MPTITCPIREELTAYAVGRLSEDESNSIAEHLTNCADCQAELATLDDRDDTLVAQLRRGLDGDPFLEESECRMAVDRARATVMGAEAYRASLMNPDSKTTLGEYELIEELGHGGMGTVYKALQTKLDRVVAVKVLPRSRNNDPKAISRFEREMKAIGRLAHDNIVQAYDARKIDDLPVLIMEFIDGLDLSEIVRRIGPLPRTEACELIRQTALALQYAHSHGLIHRDIKPSNVMLSKAGEIKLLDLGLARFYVEAVAGEEMTGSGQVMGTADYMAPEQVSDSRSVDIRADIYSLGCTLYKLLSGRAPFSGAEYCGTLEKMNAHVQQTPRPLGQLVPDLPEELAKIVHRMMAKDPADRYATPAEVAAALAPFCENADLPKLITRAISLPRESWAMAENSQQENFIPPRLATATNHRRPIVKNVFIGLAFFGMLGLAFAGGILITINREGKPPTTVEAPEGSKVNVNERGEVKIDLGKAAANETGKANSETKPAESQVKVFSLQHSDAAAMVSLIQKLLPGGESSGQKKVLEGEEMMKSIRLTADPRTNSIVAAGDAKTLEIVEAILLRLDGPDGRELIKSTDVPPKNRDAALPVKPSWYNVTQSTAVPPKNADRDKSAEKEEPIPLAQAIKEFNEKFAADVAKMVKRRELPKELPPLTEDEVIKAMQKTSPDTPPQSLQLMKSIVESTQLPGSSLFVAEWNVTPQAIEMFIYLRCWLKTGDRSIFTIRQSKIARPLSVATAKIARGDLTVSVAADGTIEPEETVDVYAQVSGKIQKLFVDHITPVKKDDVLAEIDNQSYKLQLEHEIAGRARSEAELAQAKAKLTLAKSELDNAKKIQEVKGLAAAEVDALTTKFEVAQAEIATAMANLKQSDTAIELARNNLDHTIVKSPIDGVVINRRVNLGQNVAADEKGGGMFLIAKDFDKMQVWTQVIEADIGRIRQGMDATFTVDAFPNEMFKGKVTQIRRNAQLMNNKVYYTVVVAFDNPEKKLLPYLTAKVHIEVETLKGVLLAPNAALHWSPTKGLLGAANPDGVAFWTKNEDGTEAKPVTAKLGPTDGSNTVVTEPAEVEGMEIIVGPDK